MNIDGRETIIRQRNHFIDLGQKKVKWILIDGPIFENLQQRGDRYEIHKMYYLPNPKEIPIQPVTEEDNLTLTDYKVMIWRKCYYWTELPSKIQLISLEWQSLLRAYAKGMSMTEFRERFDFFRHKWETHYKGLRCKPAWELIQFGDQVGSGLLPPLEWETNYARL